MKKIFISYCHADEEWVNRIITHLKIFEKDNLDIEVWSDTKIKVGENINQKIMNAINFADIAILVISADFLTSDYILRKEIPQLFERKQNENLKIIPFIVKPCAWEEIKWLNKLLARPGCGRALIKGDKYRIEEDLTNLSKEIKEILDNNSDNSSTIRYSDFYINIGFPVTGPHLYGRDKELRILDKAWKDKNIKIVSFIAWGGVGKTALVNEWLNRIYRKVSKKDVKIYGWSFYSQGTDESIQFLIDRFVNHLLEWFGYTGNIPQSRYERGLFLAKCITIKKIILILDGVETLQFPPGENYGKLKDELIRAFLRGFSRSKDSLCIITSRCKIEDIKNLEGNLAKTIELEHLHEKAGMLILKNYDLIGDDKKLKDISKEFGGHALALNLVGSYIKTVHGGNIKKIEEIPALLKEEKYGGHAKRVMESYEKWFLIANKAELELLYLIGLFDRPIEEEEIEIFKDEPIISGLNNKLFYLSYQDWKEKLNHLQQLKLITKKAGIIDCHPIIRKYFSEKFYKEKPSAFKKAHNRLFKYYKNKSRNECIDTDNLKEYSYLIIRHGFLAGKLREAWNNVVDNVFIISDEYSKLKKLNWFLLGKGINNKSYIIPIDKTPFLIGRSLSCDLKLPVKEISRKHAEIHISRSKKVYITDLKSTNGTYVNKVKIHKKTQLKNGDLICFANYKFRIIQKTYKEINKKRKKRNEDPTSVFLIY